VTDTSAPSTASTASTPSTPSKEAHHHRRVQIAEAALLAVVTLITAWSGFAAAKWGTESRLDLAASSSARSLANRADLAAMEERNLDASMFNTWFIAYTLNDENKQAIAERRFRPAFKVAFDAWIATDPATNPKAPAGPLSMPQYVQPDIAKAAALDATADAKAASGAHAGLVADRYVRITVFLAGVLFLVGVSSTFRSPSTRYSLVGIGGVLLVGALILLATQPLPPG
jgi:hypothetical protein